MPNRAELTHLINRWSTGDTQAGNELFAIVDRELRRIAQRRLRSDWVKRSLQPTEVVNQAFLRLAGQRNKRWSNREYFFSIIAELMNRAICDVIRYNSAARRNRALEVPFDELLSEVQSNELSPGDATEQLLSLDKAFDALKADSPQAHDVFIERALGGKTLREIARELAVSEDVAERKWKYAKAFLAEHLSQIDVLQSD